jgi:DNA-binding SARP family transcriptional activator/LysM repeat protein
MSRRAATALAARLTIALLLIGVPAALILLAGDPLPTSTQWSGIVSFQPDWGNTVLLGTVLPCAAWVAWALFAYPLIGELLRYRIGHPVLPVSGLLRAQHQLASALVTAALLSSSPAVAASPSTGTQTRQIVDAPSSASRVDRIALDTSAHQTEPLPHRRSTTAATVTTYLVRPGDTLWGIAERRLGAGTDYPAIVDQSADIVQPDGRHLTDPDLIRPGWHLDLPSAHPTTPQSPPTASPGHPAPGATAAATPPTEHTPAPTTAPSPDSTNPQAGTIDPQDDATETDGHRDDAVRFTIGGGAAALLAAGLVTALTRRRRRQRADRRFGERLPLAPEGPLHEVEEELRAVSDPDAVASLHRALARVLESTRRDAAPIPPLFAIRIDEHELTLYLHEPATLPSPFQPLFSDGTAWTAARDDFTLPVDPHSAAPYPALVTVGTDLDGGILLLDLEQQAHLRISSLDAVTARAMLNALVAELASSPWGEDIHLSLVGVPERLAIELDPYRIHRVANTSALIRDIRTHLTDRRAALDAAGIADARTARVHLADVEVWAPFVVLIGTAPTPDEQVQLDDLLRQHTNTGLVVVTMHPGTADTSEIALTEASATYRAGNSTLPPLPFIPQLLDQHTLEQTLQIFTKAAAAPARPEPTQPPPPPPPRSDSAIASMSVSSDHSSDNLLGDRAVITLKVPEHGSDTSTPSDPLPLLQDARGDVLSAVSSAPHLHLLGQVEIEHVDRPELLPGRGIELLAYLLHHRQPVAGAQIQKALWPATHDRTNGNLRSLAKQVRAALGHDPDGHLWLPEGRGNAGFTTHPEVRSDWQDFQHLTGPDPTAVPTAQLATALRLVQGQPLLGTDGHRGRWSWRATLEEAIIAAIQDAVVVLADRAIRDGDRDLVKLSVRASRFADPLSELSWQIELRAAISAGTPAQVDRIVADLYSNAGYGQLDYEPDPDTIALIRAARSPSAEQRP